ncbi:helix-turn-helix domain-containing protein [Chitinophaga vietnamensis]|uniref:helix-turn-helix domain-containing protein n=1 Tax=Chitinophaga vietnamensis TaxID=2593957 RepID=UPI00117880C8|nr:helix-turn-helix domain-containing protein [Chitinophaga vietnamensis]
MFFSELTDQPYFWRQYRYMAPSPDLAEHVVCYWLLDLRTRSPQQEEYRELLMANMYSSLVLNLGAPFEIYDHNGALLHASRHSELIGYHATPVAYRHLANNYLVGIKFKPASLNYLFHIKGSDIHQQPVLAQDALQHINDLENALFEAPDLDTVKALLERFLRRHTAIPAARPFSYVLQSVQTSALQQSGYQLKKLATMLYLSPRTLERYFSASLDISPKKCLNILRFREAVSQYFVHGYKADWEALGYCDFSHFRKACRQLHH